MIIGTHSIIYSKNVQADLHFFNDILKLASVDAGGGWLIFGLPPSEIAVHPTTGKASLELYLMCDDISVFIAKMKTHGIQCSAVQHQRWGSVTEVKLPGGGKLGVYQPLHARPKPMIVKAKKKAK